MYRIIKETKSIEKCWGNVKKKKKTVTFVMCDGSNVHCGFKAVMNTNTILRSSKRPTMKWEHQLFPLATKPQSEGLQLPLRLVDASSISQMSMQVSRCSPGEYHADEHAGVTGLSWRVSGR